MLIWLTPTGMFHGSTKGPRRACRNTTVLTWSLPTPRSFPHSLDETERGSQSHLTDLVTSDASSKVARPTSQFSCRNPTVLIWSIPTFHDTYGTCGNYFVESQSHRAVLVTSDPSPILPTNGRTSWRRNPTALIWAIPLDEVSPEFAATLPEVAIPPYTIL